MKHFLSIILRNQFNLFYRFGYTFIPENQLLEFNGNINTKIKEQIVKLFETITPFEYDQEYLILHFEKSEELNNNILKFQIQELVTIYPLSQQAKLSIESKIDTRIKLAEPIFESALPEIEAIIENEEVKKAISALWRICKIDESIDASIAKIGLENIFNGLKFRKLGIKANEIKNGNYWEYLIAYDYYQYFPEGTIRYFFQIGEVFSYYKGKINGIEGTKIEQILNEIGDGYFEQILQKFNNENLPPSFIEAMKEIGRSEFDPIIVSVLFLKWKTDLIKQDNNILESSIFHKGQISFINKFPNEVKLALVLLGAFFGFRKFYDSYYEALNLRFYKDFKTSQKQTEKEEQKKKLDVISKANESAMIAIEEEQAKTTNEQKITETTSVEECLLLTEEQQTELIVESQNDISNTQQDENKEVVSDITSQYQKIIEQAIRVQFEIKYIDILKLIKQKTGDNVAKYFAIKITDQMDGVEKVRIGNVKNPNGIREKKKEDHYSMTNERI